MKLSSILAASSAVALVLAGCSEAPEAEDTETAETDEAVAWGYGEENGPERWGDLSEDYAACSTGSEQSPVALPAAADANLTDVSTNYAATTGTIEDKGKTIQADFAEGFTLTSGDNTYDLVQVHMHTPSENTIDGRAYPLTAHFVHADGDSNLAVLGIMFEEGAANPQLQAMLDNIGGSAELDLSQLIPGELSVYKFPGSLTTPPCTEGVNWHVASTPLTASAEQIAAFTEAMGNNARPVQPANARTF